MDFKLDPGMMSLLFVKEVADWITEHCASGATSAFNSELGLVYQIEDEAEAIAFAKRWLEGLPVKPHLVR